MRILSGKGISPRIWNTARGAASLSRVGAGGSRSVAGMPTKSLTIHYSMMTRDLAVFLQLFRTNIVQHGYCTAGAAVVVTRRA